MNFSDINPFIRYSEKIDFENHVNPGAVASYDHLLIYIVDGSAQIIIKDKTHNLSRGCILIIKPGSAYEICAENHFEAILIHFDYDKSHACNQKDYIKPQPPESFDSKKIIDAYFNDSETYFNYDLIANGFNHLQNNVATIWNSFNVLPKYRDLLTASHLTIILIDISQNIKTIRTLDAGNNSAGMKILEYIHKNYNRNITLDEMSEVLNFHKSYINVLVKNMTGFSVHKYITIRRISKAVELLQYSKFSISEIAEIVGIPDISHFSKAFRNLMGKSPRQFRDSNE